jgi:ERCC4-type nuclease|tara:strand:- start:44 stop:823 length:780 start_codon:yes stop_codon:yes gene_type:complete
MEIIIDNREALIKLYYDNKIIKNESICNINYKDLIKYENLDLGDIVIKYNNEIKYIFERKTIKDLANSIKDNRYHEQKQRLKYSLPNNIKISYIFESFRSYESLNEDISICDLNGSIILSGILNTTIRDNFGIFLTKNVDETIFIIESFISRMLKNPNKYFNKDDKINNNCMLKRRKKDNITKDNMLLLCLSQIPGISEKIATTISNKFENMSQFILILNSMNDEDKIHDLSNMVVQIQNNKTRKVGRKISEKIVEYFF